MHDFPDMTIGGMIGLFFFCILWTLSILLFLYWSGE